MRRCSTCGVERPATSEFFIVNKACRDGVAGTCRACRREYHRRFRDSDEQRGKRREYHLRTYRQADSVAKELARAARRPYHDRAAILRDGMRERVKRLGLPWDRDLFTVEMLVGWLRAQPSCACCGVMFAMGRKFDGVKQDASPSLDRIVPMRGYVRGNVALLCWRCNNLKRDATADELEQIAKWMRTCLGNEAESGPGTALVAHV